MNNEELYQEALKAINALFSDLSASEYRDNLEALRDEIGIMLATLPDDD